MKKILLEELEELKKKMPIINEIDQEKYEGGAFYIDYDGGEFGQVGPSDKLHLLGTKQMYDYVRTEGLEYYGISLYDATDEYLSGTIYENKHVQQKVFSHFAKYVIDYVDPIKIVNDWFAEELYYVRSERAGVSGVLCFNRALSGMIFTYQGLTQKLLEVQKQIHQGPESTGEYDPNNPGKDTRIDRIMAVIKELDYADSKARDEFRDTRDYGKYGMLYNHNQETRKIYASQLYSIWIELGMTGYKHEISDAETACGVAPLKFPDLPPLG